MITMENDLGAIILTVINFSQRSNRRHYTGNGNTKKLSMMGQCESMIPCRQYWQLEMDFNIHRSSKYLQKQQ